MRKEEKRESGIPLFNLHICADSVCYGWTAGALAGCRLSSPNSIFTTQYMMINTITGITHAVTRSTAVASMKLFNIPSNFVVRPETPPSMVEMKRFQMVWFSELFWISSAFSFALSIVSWIDVS